MNTLTQDIRYAVRALARSRGFSVVALVSLALGIGANTAVFSVMDSVIFRPVPGIGSPDQVAEDPSDTVSFTTFEEWRGTNAVLDDVAAYGQTTASLGSTRFGGKARTVEAGIASANYFSLLQVKPALGRAFEPSDDAAGSNPVALLPDGLWRSHFGADPSVIGKTVAISGTEFEIVGVLPRDFGGTRLGLRPDIWVNLPAAPRIVTGFLARFDLRGPNMRWLYLLGRLKPAITIGAAETAMNAYFAQLPRRPGEEPQKWTLANFRTSALGQGRNDVVRFLQLLAAAVGLVLLIACANVANLLLIRGVGRRREIAIRLAIGATQRRLLQQLVTESLLLSTLGGILGLFIAAWAADLIAFLQLPGSIEMQGVTVGLNARVLVFALVTSIGTGVLLGLLPAWQGLKSDLISGIRSQSSRLVSPRSMLRDAFVALQLALSVLLLIAAGLFVRSLQTALRIDLGFNAENLAGVTVEYGLRKYDGPRIDGLRDEVLERVRTDPRVTSAAWAQVLPLGGNAFTATIGAQGQKPSDFGRFLLNTVSAGYFQTMEIPVLRGRDFTKDDYRAGSNVVMVNESAARKLWGNEYAVGKFLTSGDRDHEVIGVVRDAHCRTILEQPQPQVFFPLREGQGTVVGSMRLVVRATDPEGVLPLIRSQIEAFDKELPISQARTYENMLGDVLMPQRFGIMLLGFFSTVAVVLSSIGLYGVVAYNVRQRYQEIGIRMALGARQNDVLKLCVRSGALPAMIGVMAGIATAIAATRLLSAFLFGVSPTDTATFFVTAAVLVLVSAVASYVPARKATLIEPAVALRHE